MPYERTQEAVWATTLLGWSKDPRVAKRAPAARWIVPLLLAGSMLSRLTIRVDAAAVTWHLGWGFPGGSIAIGAIDRVEITQTNLLEGWGLNWSIWQNGWLWSVGGFQAVKIFKTAGSSVTLGTDDPQGLVAAIERVRHGV